jgi:hypothetical protein
MLLTQVRAEIDPIRQAIDAHQATYEQYQSGLSGAIMRVPQSFNTSMAQLQRTVESQSEMQVLSQTELERSVAANTAEIRKLQAAVECWVSLRGSFRDGDVIVARDATNPWSDFRERVTKW